MDSLALDPLSGPESGLLCHWGTGAQGPGDDGARPASGSKGVWHKVQGRGEARRPAEKPLESLITDRGLCIELYPISHLDVD